MKQLFEINGKEVKKPDLNLNYGMILEMMKSDHAILLKAANRSGFILADTSEKKLIEVEFHRDFEMISVIDDLCLFNKRLHSEVFLNGPRITYWDEKNKSGEMQDKNYYIDVTKEYDNLWAFEILLS
jgi:hypothetical protein